MDFVHHDLGRRNRGEIVEISLNGNAANVQLMDSSNLSRYKRGQNYRYTGGLAKKSPVRLAVPSTGHWHVAVDLRGMASRARVKSSARVLPAPLPALRGQSLAPLAEHVRHIIEDPDEPDREWDVFISHATEDKVEVARPLAAALTERDVTVWYDETSLRIGDSVRRSIDRGLARSRFGVVVVSPSFFAKNWSQYELDGLVTREMTGEQIILPLWHQITKAQVISNSPSLADKLARSTATMTIDEIADEIAEVAKGTVLTD